MSNLKRYHFVDIFIRTRMTTQEMDQNLSYATSISEPKMKMTMQLIIRPIAMIL